MEKKELFYETVTGIEKLELYNQYYIAGVVKGMLTKAQQLMSQVEEVDQEQRNSKFV
ncbi:MULTISPECIES: hypothetical protein [Bacillus cereus group]|uniref:Uncharacterized protein n=1 Tax=Bacillus cereus VD154 TaxID=1053238 RepID=A0A9W5KSC9_BACCE|nr:MULTISPECIES: hypothetical protein [Bacillus cereus group]MEB8733066.1 hypothetical protein [Bacillus cereus]EEM44213.1 hypothetical protein bthur0005_60780 [Bacillus thuringiensis serovar pakistani str. T13001]EJR67252.1 hypothetical protein IK5_05316 [Bacillus cereus VD154]MEB8751773.1 hypothetical protein [Bacillus cereus]MEB8764294.1 hypothetical protein [Bacillus cereus]